MKRKSPSLKKQTYQLTEDGSFIIHDYNFAKPFSSFFPGVSGLWGRPLWAFYVNRGQGLVSFGSLDKDRAIMEFLPANQAYERAGPLGFRTFIKVRRKNKEPVFYEPFLNTKDNQDARVKNQMRITSYDLRIEEINTRLGLKVTVRYFPLPAESIGALVRLVRVENIGRTKVQIEVLDGMPKVVPYGMDNFCLKNISRTIESMMKISNYDRDVPFFHLKTEPQDRPEVVLIKSGSFYLTISRFASKKTASLVRPLVDPAVIFGPTREFLYPHCFLLKTPYRPGKQILEGRTPCAFSLLVRTLAPKSVLNFTSFIGQADHKEKVNRFAKKILADPAYVDKKSIENRSIIEGLTNHTDTLTSHKAFNAYIRQNYLDNVLRGGYPLPIHTKKGKEIFYVYSRKHGDLERDYNSYVVPPTYFSQGNGNYRDINQNRRNDIFFNPEVEDSNLILFMSMLQADGFNPHVLKRLTFQLRDRALARKLKTCVKDSLDFKKLSAYLTKSFDPGALFLWLEKENILLAVSKDKFLNSVLSICEKDEDIFHGEGFWSDHWHYNNDLIESFLSVYPDRLRELLLDRAVYTFYDNDHRVVPRSEKYVLWEGQVRQFGSVVHDPKKTELIESRSYDKNKLRLGNGHGEIYRTNLFTKILFIFANKIASLDMEGIGIEMESDKPNWNDSLNGLPGLFGSSTAETCELVRMIRTLKENMEDLSLPDEYILDIPRELSEFLNKIETALDHWKGNHASSKHYDYWEASTSAKEKFREDIRMGLNGDLVSWRLEMIKPLLDKADHKLQNSLERAKAPKSQVMSTYFRSTAKDFQPSGKTNPKGYPCMNISGFKHQALPLFLEGPVHLFRILKNDTKSKRLYQAIKRSPLFDKKLKMYKVSSSMAKEPPEIGRIQIFSPGWLENESVWMHMEYKYLLEILRSGLTREFYNDMKTCLVPFMDPKTYGRSILENSSFICSSAYPDDLLHGNGFVARLSGSTAEWIHIWILMMLGTQPFRLDQDKKLQFVPEPSLDAWLFTNKKHVFQGVLVAKNSLAFVALKDTLFIYSNPKRKPTFGAKRVKVQRFTLTWRDGRTEDIAGGFLRGKSVYDIRQGRIKLVEMQLG